ncbi:heterokaryon incompatibility protein-domain-containing protein [Astrocystis sublimbata]|nr:heterokaryon incompatibility protein-domain-containing protein [Astrocystis sublimbata]
MPSKPSIWSRFSEVVKDSKDGFMEGWNSVESKAPESDDASREEKEKAQTEPVRPAMATVSSSSSSGFRQTMKDAYREEYKKSALKKMTPEEKARAAEHAEYSSYQTRLQEWLHPTDKEEQLENLTYEKMPPSPIHLIRIVHLLPGEGWDAIEVVIETTAIDSADYEALSYTWGDQADTYPIICNGRRLDVTRNLKLALRDLRRPDSPRLLWIDAICINQGDVDDRTQQVSRMRDVYSNAQQTISWLGQTFVGVDIAFALLQRLHDVHHEGVADGTFDFRALLYKDEKIPEESIGTGPSEAEVSALYKLLDRPYFRRCWIIQEIALGRKSILKCGDHELPWDVFHSGALLCFYLGWHGAESKTTLFNPVFKLDSARSSAVNGSDIYELELLELLRNFRTAAATDPRDKVFSLLGLTVTDLDELELTADYRLETEEVYMQVTKAIIAYCDTLDIFAVPRGNTALAAKLPSWVCDWSDTKEQLHSYFAREHSGNPDNPPTPFNASGFSTLPIPIFLPGNRLQLRGHRIDRIRSIAGALPDSNFEYSDYTAKVSVFEDPERGMRENLSAAGDMLGWSYRVLADVSLQTDMLVQWDDFVLGIDAVAANAMYGATGEPREVAYMKTLCGDFMAHGEEFALQSFRSWKEERWAPAMLRKAKLHKVPFLHQALGAASTMLPSKHPNRPFAGVIEESLRRCIAWSESGLLGMMAPGARQGDDIWLIQGCRLPLTLRQKPDSADYELVGDCYIHGVMYGERFRELACQTVVIA